jgi:YfiH family protein
MVRVDVAGGTAEIRCSTLAHGDFHIEVPRAALEHRRRSFAPGVWTQLDEVHGTDVRTVTRAGEHDYAVGDALVTRLAGVVLAVWVGDCAPVVLVGDDGALGAAHAGWKGALAGVLPATAAAMGCAHGAVRAFLGPCIHACCYEFAPADLEAFVDRFGPSVAATTSWGTPALDLPAVVRCSLGELGVGVTDIGGCTGCRDDVWFSHRMRRQPERQVVTVCRRAAT